MAEAWQTYRCSKCRKVLLEAHLEGQSRVRKICDKCGHMNVIVPPQPALVPDGQGGFVATPIH